MVIKQKAMEDIMNKILAYFGIFLMLSSVVFAQGQGAEGQGAGVEDSETRESGQDLEQNASQGEKVVIAAQQKVKASSSTELKEMIQQRQQQMSQEVLSAGKKVQGVYQNQNRVRLAVHALLAMEDITGGLGKNISAIARNFNNSVQATIRAEEKIQTRSGFARFFAGGDAEAAEDMEREVTQNQDRIQQLKQLREDCDCDGDVKLMMQEQIQNMELEQTRLQQLAQSEKKSRGLFGWIWK